MLMAFLLGGPTGSAEEDKIDIRFKSGCGGIIWNVCSDGDYLYTAHGQGLCGMSIIDVSDPLDPKRTAFVKTEGAREIVVSGNYAYVADGDGGFVIIDIRDKESPLVMGRCPAEGYAYNVAVQESYAYVACHYTDEISIIDIRDVSDPRIVGSIEPDGISWDLHISGDHLYAAYEHGGMHIINVSNASDPFVEGNYQTKGTCSSVFLRGEHAFIGDSKSGLVVVDITNKSSPFFVAATESTESPRDIVISGEFAYFVCSWDGMITVDVSDVINLTLVSHYDNNTYRSYGLCVFGDHAAIAAVGEGVQIVDISDPSDPRSAGRYWTFHGGDSRFDVYHNSAFIALTYQGLKILDISDPNDPVMVSEYHGVSDVYDVAAVRDYVYIAAGEEGLIVLDVSNLSDPVEVYRYDIRIHTYRIAIYSSYLFLVNEYYGEFYVFDISDKARPELKGSCGFHGRPEDIACEYYYVYIATDQGLNIIKVYDKSDPSLLKSYDPGYDLTGVSYLYNSELAISGNDRLEILDVFDRGDPECLATYDLDGHAYSVDYSSNFLYASTDEGLVMLDIADRSNPRYFANYPVITQQADFYSGNLIHVLGWEDDYSILEKVPKACIDCTWPNPALDRKNINFVGHGTTDTYIKSFVWRSSIDGIFHNFTGNEDSMNFFFDGLSNGNHTIYLKVMNSYDVWSDEVEADLVINYTYTPPYTLYVGGTGERNYTTIQEAVSFARNGDTVRVMDGVYNENVRIRKSISLIGNGSDSTVIIAKNKHDAVQITGDGVLLSGLNITQPSQDAQGLWIESNNNQIIGNQITGNFIGCTLYYSRNNTLRLNEFSENHMRGLQLHAGNNNTACIDTQMLIVGNINFPAFFLYYFSQIFKFR